MTEPKPADAKTDYRVPLEYRDSNVWASCCILLAC